MNRLKFVVPWVLVVLCGGVVRAETPGRECPKTITFLSQMSVHSMVRDVDAPTVEQIAKSQFRIARYLSKHQNVPVFSEQIFEDIRYSDLRGQMRVAANQAKQVFPNGIPRFFEDLNAIQKRYLVVAGGDGVMLLTGRIRTLHRVVPDEATHDLIAAEIKRQTERTTDSQISNEQLEAINSIIYDLATTVREHLALTEINRYFAQNPRENSAILIFSHTHDFREHGKLFPAKCIETPLN